MKTKRFFIATLLVVAATSIAVVSCKKETLNALSNNTSQSVKTFAIPQVDDMNAYLKDFKKKMQTATRDGNETLSLEEAAWHLSSVANYDFANTNVEFTNLFYDTLYYQVNVTNGRLAMSELNAVYENITNDIDAFYQNLDLQEKHFRYIGTSIADSGVVTVNLVVTYIDPYHLWYPSDSTNCNTYFNPHSAYSAFGYGMTELKRVLNIIDSQPIGFFIGRTYLIFSREIKPLFTDHIDQYGAPNFMSSRIYCTRSTYNVNLSLVEMCYYLSSYHALGYELIMENEAIANWDIVEEIFPYDPREHNTYYHELAITYGRIIEVIKEEEQFGY